MALAHTDASAADARCLSGSDLERDHSGVATALAELRAGRIKFISASPTFAARLGLSEDLAGRGLDEVCSPSDARRLSALVEQCAQDRRPGRIDRALRSDTYPTGSRVSAFPVDWGGSEAEQVILAMPPAARTHHLTARNETLFDHLGPISSGMLYVYDVIQRRTRYIHPELAESLGLSPTGAGLSEVQDRLHPGDRTALQRHLETMAALKDQEVCETQLRLRGAEGDWRIVQSRARVFSRTPEGAVRRVIGVASDVTAAVAQAKALARAQEDVARAELDERRRIGRELHDSTAQHLVAIGLSLAALERRAAFDDSHQAILRDIRNAISAAHREIRTFSFMLHPPQARGRDLVERLRVFADGFGRRASLRISVEVAGRPRATSSAQDGTLFRIFQEALMNVHRHTAARSVRAVLNYVGAEVSLLIEDDGGRPADGHVPTVDDETGVGISSMRGRLIELGGRLELEPGAGGMRLKAQLPLQARQNEIRVLRREPAGNGEVRSFAPRRLGLDAGRAPPGLA